MVTLWQDIRYGFRMLAREPGFSAIVVLILAVGVGASTTVFGILNPLLIRPLPYEEPDRIVCVQGRNQEGHARNVSHPDYWDWRRQAASFEELGCYTFRDRPISITGDEPPEECSVGFVSDNFFRVFPVRPVVGRLFSEEDDHLSAAPATVISHAYWRRHFAADPSVVGKSVLLDGRSHTVIGVAPSGFDFPPYGANPTDVWVAVDSARNQGGRGNRTLYVLGRLKAGVSVHQAQAEVDTICGRLAAEYPSSNAGISATVVRLHDHMAGQIGQIPSILMGTVLLVFLVACANVAGLMFARGVTREREMALRSTLGGTRLRLMRMMLMENVIPALLGGGLGLLAATWALKLLLAVGVLPSAQFPAGFFRPDGRVLGFALALSILAVPGCSLIPSLCCSGVSLARMLAAGGRSIFGSRGRNVAQGGLLAAQIALTIVLLVAAGLMVRSLVNAATAERGFDSERVLVMDLQLAGEKYATPESRLAFHQQLLRQLGDTSGVEKAALTFPLFAGMSWYFHVEGESLAAPNQEGTSATYKIVSPGYFEAMGIRLLQGRFFDERDQVGSPPVVVVDATLAARYWPAGDWIGKRVKTNKGTDPNTPWSEVVGVVGHVKNGIETDAEMQIYQSLSQKVQPVVSVVLRARSDPKGLIAVVRDAVHRIDGQQLVSHARTLEEDLWYDLLVHRLITSLLAVFAGVALLLSAVGVYAVTRYWVSRRIQEFGIRAALGATSNDILRLALYRGMRSVLVGTGIGLAGAVAVVRVLSSLLYQLSPWDPATYAAVSLLLCAVVLVAGYLPARRAARIDPMVALRYE
jgi:putative ABC transport system permease protein